MPKFSYGCHIARLRSITKTPAKALPDGYESWFAEFLDIHGNDWHLPIWLGPDNRPNNSIRSLIKALFPTEVPAAYIRAITDKKDFGESGPLLAVVSTETYFAPADKYTTTLRFTKLMDGKPTGDIKHYYILGGGTVEHIAPHLALSAPAYGTFARQLKNTLTDRIAVARGLYPADVSNVHLVLTKMANPKNDFSPHVKSILEEAGLKSIESSQDLEKFLAKLTERVDTKCVVMNAAVCDFTASELTKSTDGGTPLPIGKHADRLDSKSSYNMSLVAAPKLLRSIRKKRKDIFLVAFKTTAGDYPGLAYAKALELLKTSSANLVVSNDIVEHTNFIVTPEEARYHETKDRRQLALSLADMIFHRTQLTFTRSDVVDGEPVPWSSPEVPPVLRAVVDHLIAGRAYKSFLGATVGHFAVRLSDTEFLTSIRKTNFNNLDKVGLVRVRTSGPDTVIAYGARPSVGGQSQRIVFGEHPGYDCIAHAHIQLKKHPRDAIPVISQREYECGSHACGERTSKGLKDFAGIKAVYLQNHGPNIVFSRTEDPQRVIDFIEANFEVGAKTGDMREEPPVTLNL
jgi:hypothetical protein